MIKCKFVMNGKKQIHAFVLSGGGARGAYEVGIIKFIREKLSKNLGFQPRFEILSGTSVGAVHACFLASTADMPEKQVELLENIWHGFDFESVYRFGFWHLLRIPRRLFGEKKTTGLERKIGGILDTSPLEELVIKKIHWRKIGENIKNRFVNVLSVSATEISTGRSIIFIQHNYEKLSMWSHDPFVIPKEARINPIHALASAAIPIIFPLVRIGDKYHCDGSLRLNTPLSPALRLGADKVLIIGLKHKPLPSEVTPQTENTKGLANPIFLLGKLINALMLDHTQYDIDRLRIFNDILSNGEKAFGEKFLDYINSVVVKKRGIPYRNVEEVYITPSQDI
ncbi:MAG TPA: patatin-like phospholipase family protein, partial [bacterium]